MHHPTPEDIFILEAKFSDSVVFSKEELQRTAQWSKLTLVGKFLRQGFPLDFIQKEMKNHCQMIGDFQVIS